MVVNNKSQDVYVLVLKDVYVWYLHFVSYGQGYYRPGKKNKHCVEKQCFRYGRSLFSIAKMTFPFGKTQGSKLFLPKYK